MTHAIRRMAGHIGAEIVGIDLASDLSEETVTELRSAFVEHQVLMFRDQELSPEAQIRFGRHFGELDAHPFIEMNSDHPEILDVITQPDDTVNFGGGWHSDLTFMAEPDLGSILYAVEVPQAGGDTLFSSQRAAHDALSDTMRELLGGLVAVHTPDRQYTEGGLSTQSKAMIPKTADGSRTSVEHPVVRTHPESGQQALYVNQAFTSRIRRLRQNESDALLSFLYEHSVSEQFTCRVRWEAGTLAMWDNRSVQHFALHDYAGQRRHMRRITIKGDRPF